MQKYVHVGVAGVLLALMLLPGWTIRAAPLFQENIPLANAGFEEGAGGWGIWSKPEEIVRVGKEIDVNSSWYTPLVVENTESRRVHNGSRAIEFNNEYRRWRGGVYQTVSAPAGAKVVFKAWVQAYTDVGQPLVARVGIDPNGGADGNSGAVIWSGAASVGESYVKLETPEVTVGAGGRVTVFTWGEASFPYNKSAVFFDDTGLKVVGQSTPPTAPPAQPQPPPVVQPTAAPAQPQPDGSLVYVVQPGDTLGAIAFAHNTSVDEIMRLNGLSSTLISVGQRLVIRGATVPPTPTTAPTPDVPPTPSPTPVPPTGQICIQAFNDRDGNGQPGGVGEDLLPGVTFALSSAQSAPKNYVTDGLNEPYCFVDLPPDTFAVKIVPPSGYNATTPEIWNLGIAAGQKVEVNFGARRGGAAPTPTLAAQPAPGGGGGSLLAGAGRFILGALAVIALVGLGAAAMYFFAARR